MMKTKYQQQGFSLFMVMIMMIVIALLVVVTSQSTSTESRLSTNETDRKYALSLAEVGLREAEQIISSGIYQKLEKEPRLTAPLEFKANCTGRISYTNEANQNVSGVGLCAPSEKIEFVQAIDKDNFKVETVNNDLPAWKRANAFSSNNSIASGNKTRFIIEYLGQRVNNDGMVNDYFRITSRAHGNNAQTEVTLQSYVEMSRNP